ncbi:sugar phosphate isomerase [Bacillus sp. AFS076308]|uniref:sugar phosphate isomerase/epimerase family protein n=1 Tax=unclassified Bacillus (in: firmicutes) TaxID=185979 RepID=UPI000BF77F19|nr:MULTISPECIES: sugar phosphate isomerase/epimerase family protein [unclassified Bacillus (in: firmicutes)]PFN99577.1 sugar phosphate isomerase [Bacillus sp. AFS076308]PGV50251.1 sugar phosphate isomerase [Bacillus sp. AFS037270]
MKFGASTFIWVSPFSNQTLNLIDKVKNIGFDYLEICIEDPETIDVAAIRNHLDKTGVEALVCGAFGPNRDISSEDVAIREQGIEYIKTCIDIAAELGSPLVSGPMYSATGKTRLLTPEEKEQQWAWAAENMKIVADYAAEKNIRLAVEILNRFETDFINTVQQGLDFLDLVDCDNVGFLLDTFHMNLEEKDIAEAIKLAGSKIFNFHSCENDRGTPGTGHIPWNEVFQALKEISYDGPVVIESFTTEIKEIARAVSQWRPLAPSQDSLGEEGLQFLKKAVLV